MTMQISENTAFAFKASNVSEMKALMRAAGVLKDQ